MIKKIDNHYNYILIIDNAMQPMLIYKVNNIIDLMAIIVIEQRLEQSLEQRNNRTTC